MTPQAREQLRAELTGLVQRRRADYLRLKGAGREITRGELAEAGAAYERALVLRAGSWSKLEVIHRVELLICRATDLERRKK